MFPTCFFIHFVVSSNTRVLIYSDNALMIYFLGNQVYIMHIGCCLPYADHQLKAWTVESPTLLIADTVFNVAMLHNCRHLISIASITKVNQSVVLMMLCGCTGLNQSEEADFVVKGASCSAEEQQWVVSTLIWKCARQQLEI